VSCIHVMYLCKFIGSHKACLGSVYVIAGLGLVENDSMEMVERIASAELSLI
jgi:hypothetical protein